MDVILKPLEQQVGSLNVLLGRLGLRLPATFSKDKACKDNSQEQSTMLWIVYGVAGVVGAVLFYQLVLTDLGLLLTRLCGLLQPIFSMSCAFYWLALYLRKSWSTTSIYVLFCSCFVGEFLGQCLSGGGGGDLYIAQPFLSLTTLAAVSIGSMFSTLETPHSTFVIGFVSLIRFVACTSLTDLPQILRPITAYCAGVAGVIGAKYMETTLKPPAAAAHNHRNRAHTELCQL